MRTWTNPGTSARSVAWCSLASHYAAGQHTGTLGRSTCRMQSHTVAPKARITADETAPNGPTVATVLAQSLVEV